MSLLHLTAAELRRSYLLGRSYLFALVADQVMFILGFLLIVGVFESATEGQFSPQATLASLVGYLVWRVAAGCMVEVSGTLTEEAQNGTLEQLVLHAPRLAWVLLARGVALVVYYSLQVAVMGLVLLLLLRLPLPFAPGAVVVYLLTLLSPIGLALLFGGLHLRYKNVDAVVFPLATLLLLFSGAMASVEGIPIIFEISRVLPLSMGIDLLREIMVAQRPLVEVMQGLPFWLMLGKGVLYFVLGMIVFRWALAGARSDGSLGHY